MEVKTYWRRRWCHVKCWNSSLHSLCSFFFVLFFLLCYVYALLFYVCLVCVRVVVVLKFADSWGWRRVNCEEWKRMALWWMCQEDDFFFLRLWEVILWNCEKWRARWRWWNLREFSEIGEKIRVEVAVMSSFYSLQFCRFLLPSPLNSARVCCGLLQVVGSWKTVRVCEFSYFLLG